MFQLAAFYDGLMFQFAAPTRNNRTEPQAERSRVRFQMSSLEFFHWHNPMALGSTQTPTEMSTRNISWGVKAAGA